MNEEIDIDIDNVINKYADMINKILFRYLQSKEDCEDLIQETFITYVRHIKSGNKFETDEHEKCWLLRVALNLCCNKMKYNNLRKTMPLNEDICYNLEVNVDNRLIGAISKLEKKYRNVFELFYFDDLKISEIAKILKISESNVKTRLKRARDKIKELMKKGEK